MKLMKTIYHLLCAAALLAGFTACSSDPDAFGGGEGTRPAAPETVQFHFGMAQTRTATDAAYKTTFLDGDAVGLFAVRHGSSLAASGNYADNVKFTCTNGVWSGPEGEELIFPADGSSLDFYAYYPYRENVDPTDFGFTTAADQSAADFYAANDLLLARTQNVRNETVDLSFRHALALVNVQVIARNLPAFDNSMVVTLHNCAPAASVDLAAGTAVLADSPKTDIRMSRVESDPAASTYNYRALVPAQSVEAGTVIFSFIQETPGSEIRYNYTAAAAKELPAGGVAKWQISIGGGEDLPVYAVGDYYPDATNAEGVVFEISDGGTHGKVVYLREAPSRPDEDYKCTRWGIANFLQSENGAPGMGSLTDGETATRQLIAARRNDPNFASDYSAFNYILVTCNGGDPQGAWYMPAIEELKSLFAAAHGINYPDIAAQWLPDTTMPGRAEGIDHDPAAAQAFCAKITGAGGENFNFYSFYCSSSEMHENNMYTVNFELGTSSSAEKNNEWAHVRPIRKF